MDNTMKCWCRHCKQELESSHTGPCPNCGKTGKDCSVTANVTIGIRAESRARLKRKGVKKFVLEMISRWRRSGDPRLTEGVHEEMVIDKEKDEYHQVVRDVRTGDITHEEHEPLRKHKTTPRGKAGQ